MVKAKVFIYENRFDGFPKETDLKLVEEELPDLQEGEFLAEAVYLSVDPYMRIYADRLPTGGTFIGSQVAKITESKNSKFPVGKHVLGYFGWRTHTIWNENHTNHFKFPTYLLPDFGNLPLSLGLGIVGMPGATAYFGFLEICEPKRGQTVVVSGAGGAVGSIVGQIAKIKGCEVIGITGSDEKGKWLVEELGFDHFINYKTADLLTELQKVAPKGVDCYYDNVGGDLSFAVLNNMNRFGRIAVCGSISGYNEKQPKASIVQYPVLFKELRMEGFIFLRWVDRYLEAINQNLEWVKDGKLKYQETVTEGFENMFKGFVGMLNGDNTGKAVVKA